MAERANKPTSRHEVLFFFTTRWQVVLLYTTAAIIIIYSEYVIPGSSIHVLRIKAVDYATFFEVQKWTLLPLLFVTSFLNFLVRV